MSKENSIDSLLRADSKGESIIDSVNIGYKVKQLTKYLEGDISNTDIIKIADFFCNKIYEYVFLSSSTKEIIIEKLRKAVFETNTMTEPLRLSFLRFKSLEISYITCCKLYYDGIRTQLEPVSYFQILNYVLRSEYTEKAIRMKILDEFETIFSSIRSTRKLKMQIADIFILNGRTERGHEMLDVLRNIDDIARFGLLANKRNTIYDDSQNTHNQTINKSVISAAISLIGSFPSTKDYNSEKLLVELSVIAPSHKNAITDVLERISIDTARFRLENNTFSLQDLFSSLWVYINKNKHSDELKTLLIEEMVAMHEYCSTGHLARFMNVIQGFTHDSTLMIRISDFDQIKSVIYNYLNTALKSANEDVTDSMISDDPHIFLVFILENINNKIPEMVKDYASDTQDLSDNTTSPLEYIKRAVIKYTNYTGWNIENGILKLDTLKSRDTEV